MTFHNVKLPDWFSLFATGKLVYNTEVVTNFMGYELRNTINNFSIQKYIIKNCLLSSEQFQEFSAFFRGRYGRKFSFRMRDFTDYQTLRAEKLLPIGNGNSYQLIKTYDDVLNPTRRIITKPIISTIKVASNDASIDEFTVDSLTGIITMDQSIENQDSLKAKFEFDVEVRFDNDSYEYSYRSDGAIMLSDIELIEVINNEES
jgi:uncharacterized protein (TIGR02217 family)